MTTYFAPTRDMRFVIEELAGLDQLTRLSGYEDATPDLVEAVLGEAAKLAGEVLAPLNKTGDAQGVRLEAGSVRTADGFKAAYQQFVEGGWSGISSSPEYGGQGLPELVLTATMEMWNAANMSFAMCALLTIGATEALKQHGSGALKSLYLPNMVSGTWTGTMNLTEPQAGSDLSAIRTKAVPDADHYRLYGQKIFISWGDHDLTDNVVHLVLARTPDAPDGVKGISLFLVPKFLVNADGSLGQRNDVHCVSTEHKMGIHASPTCVMSFGDRNGAIGYLIGQENKGLAHMFTMMNEVRQKVGLEGLGIADRAYQQARGYAKERVQGRALDQKSGDRVAIIQHPDVRRMLMTMKSQVEAMRTFAYVMAVDMDLAHKHPDAAGRQRHQARVDLLTPVMKGWCTELSVEIASTGIQVHGGMGYVEETGACQHFRDARVTPIYEGTTGIQAADLVGRKLAMDQGAAMAELIQEIRGVEAALAQTDNPELMVIGESLAAGIQALEQATQWVLQTFGQNPNAAVAASKNYLMLTGYVCGGWQMARAALVAKAKLDAGEDPGFYGTKLATARFYAEQILPQADALLKIVRSGGSSILTLSAEQF